MIKSKHSLKSFNTFGIDVIAEKFCSVSDVESLIYLLNTKPIKIHILGGGSNILFSTFKRTKSRFYSEWLYISNILAQIDQWIRGNSCLICLVLQLLEAHLHRHLH